MADRYYVEDSYWQENYSGYQADGIVGLGYYIDENYFDNEGYYEYRGSTVSLTAELNKVHLVEATISSTFTQNVTAGTVKKIAEDFEGTISLSCTISHIEGADLQAFTDAQLTANIDRTRGADSALTVDGNLTTDVSKVLSAQATVESTVTFATQGDLYTNRTLSFSSEFAQTTTAERIRGDSSTIVSEFTFLGLPDIITPTGEIKEFAATLTDAFAQQQTVELYKDMSADFYMDAVCDPDGIERIRLFDSTQSVEFAQTAVSERIIQGACAFDALFSPSMSAEVVKNTFAVLDSTTALAGVATANRSADIALSSIVNQSLQGDRTRDYAANMSSTVQISCTALRVKSLVSSISSTTATSIVARKRAGLFSTTSAQFAISCTPTEIQGIQLTLFNTASISSTIRINAKPSLLIPTRYTGFDVSFQFKLNTGTDQINIEAINPVHYGANIVRKVSASSDVGEVYSGNPIKLASNITFAANETKNISLVGGGTGKTAIKAGEKFYIRPATAGNAADYNKSFTANADITDATTSVSVSSGAFGGGTFLANSNVVANYMLPNSPLTVSIIGPTALGGSGTTRISMGWWAADKETAFPPPVYGYDQFLTSILNISQANQLDTWHTCRVYADAGTWPNAVLQINGQTISFTPQYSTSFYTYAPSTSSETYIFGSIDSIEQTSGTGLIRNTNIIQNGTYNSFPQEIGVATLTPISTVSVSALNVQQTSASITASFAKQTAVTRLRSTATSANVQSTVSTSANKIISAQSTLSSTFNKTITAKKFAGFTVNASAQSTLSTTGLRYQQFAAQLAVNTAIFVDEQYYSGTGADLYAEALTSASLGLIKRTNVALSAFNTQLTGAVKTGQGFIQCDLVTAQTTQAVKTVEAHADLVTVITQVTDAVKTARTSINVQSQLQTNVDVGRTKEFEAVFTVVAAQADIDIERIRSAQITCSTLFQQTATDYDFTKAEAALTFAVTLDNVTNATKPFTSTLTVVAQQQLGVDTRIRFSGGLFSTNTLLDPNPYAVVRPTLLFESISVQLTVGQVISFDPALQLYVVNETRTLLVPEEQALLTVAEETRVNMVRKFAI